MTKDEALKLALEALRAAVPVNAKDSKIQLDAIFAIREALAEQPAQQQEPVAWMWKDGTVTADPDRADGTWTPLYKSPQPSKPLTDADIEQIYGDHHDKFGQPVDSKENGWAYERAIISAALGVKETK